MILIISCTVVFVGMDSIPSLDLAQGGQSANSNDVIILAKMITGEARGEPYIGQVGVGAVIMNRVKDKKFPNSIHSVCFQPGAFDAVRDGQFFRPPTKEALRAARDAINGYDPTYGSLYYWNPAKATSKWIWSRSIIMRIGKHVFGR